MDSHVFAASVLERVPEVGPVYEEHLADHSTLLLHLFVADLRRFCEAAWAAENRDLVQRLLECLAVGLVHGDEQVEDAVAVSFVEDSRYWDTVNDAYVSAWPDALLAEVTAQRDGRGR